MITSFITFFIVLVVLFWMFKTAKNAKPMLNEDGGCLLSYSEPIKRSCMGMVIFSLVCLTAVLLFNLPEDKGDWFAIAGLYAFFILLGFYFYIEFFTVKIIVGSNGIKGTSGWRGERSYSWAEIDEISYSINSMWFTISAKGKKTLRIHAFISGIDGFQSHYMEHMPEEKWKKAKTYNKFHK